MNSTLRVKMAMLIDETEIRIKNNLARISSNPRRTGKNTLTRLYETDLRDIQKTRELLEQEK